jgi:hypothetical protein
MVSERASQFFKFGYWDKQDGNPQWTRGGAKDRPGTFAHADYLDGWNSRQCEERAAAKLASRNK